MHPTSLPRSIVVVMGWRQITGSTLVALLLVTMALPAMCGECQNRKPDQDCTGNHEPSVNQHGGSASTMDAACDSCGNHERMNSVNLLERRDTPCSAFLKSSYRSCHRYDTQVAAMNNGTKRDDLQWVDRATLKAGAHDTSATACGNSSGITEAAFSTSTCRPFLVILKI
jgi:hypothetical protein